MLSIIQTTSIGRLARFLVRPALACATLVAVGCGSNASPGGLDPDRTASSEQALLTGATAFGFAYVRGGAVVASRSYNERVDHAGTPTATSVYGSNSVTRTALGAYTVRMSGLGMVAGGNAQVVSDGSGANRCHLVSWLASGSDETVNVQCNTPSGAAADTDFDVMFYVSNGTWASSPYADSAYAYFSPSGAMPSGIYNYNSTTGGTMPNTVSPAGVGVYNVTLPKVHYQNASVMVSAYANVGAPYCKIGSWTPSGVDTVVSVACFDTNGNPASGVGFSLSYSTSGPTLGQEGGHAWITGGTMPSSYASVTGPYQGCSGTIATSGNGITVSGLSVWGPPYSSGTMAQTGFTTAYGPGSAYCNLSSLVTTPTGATANVQCYTATGAPTTTPFTVMTTSNQPSGPC